MEGPDGKETLNFVTGVSLDSSPLLQGVTQHPEPLLRFRPQQRGWQRLMSAL